jgi:hypothetical protein
MIKSQFFGMEVEMTGITREEAATALAERFGTIWARLYDEYDTYEVTDREGKSWKLSRDVSIKTERKIESGEYESTLSSAYSVELVSPKLEYSEMGKLQDAVATLRGIGANVNKSCGVHVHVDGKNHNAQTLKNLMGIMHSKEDLIFKALDVNPCRAAKYCQPVLEPVLLAARREKRLTLAKLRDIWYEDACSQWRALAHYDKSRYRALNLHAFFNKGTVEFRMFNSTLDDGEIKAYATLALAISAKAIGMKSVQLKKTETGDNDKFAMRVWLKSLNLTGKEFESVRMHLTKRLEGDSAWRFGSSKSRAI